MSEQKSCNQCGRAIDAWAKLCPFCNWDQERPAPATKPVPPAAVSEYRPPEEFDLKRKALMLGAGLLVLVAAFGVGVFINSDDAPETAPPTVEEQNVEERGKGLRRADTPLVPTDQPGGIEQPITSAPVAATGTATPDGYARTDATAVSATEYEQIAKRAKAEKDQMAALVDPRSLTGPAYAQAPRPRRRTTPPPTQRASESSSSPANPARAINVRTRPVPEYQPLPRISSSGTARLMLTIGSDGRVSSVEIQRGLPGADTAELVSAVRRWRFRPATENGEPVSAPYSVDISFDR